MRFRGETAPSNPLGGPAAQEIARYASHGSERNRSGVLAKEIGRPNVDLGNHAIDNLAGNLIGSTLGGLIPSLWGDGIFTYSSVLLSGVGAFVGLWVGYKISV